MAQAKKSAQKNSTRIYELDGKALQAAKQLEQELEKELRTVPVKQSGSFKEIGDSWDNLYDGLLKRLEKEAPELLEMTGLKSPTILIYNRHESLPRAYVQYPHIFSSPEQNPRYFMYVPVDYKGNHFVPADSVMITDEQEQRISDLLFAGGWLGNAPIINRQNQGVATPADYTPPSKTQLQEDKLYSPPDHVCFIPAGRSLEILKDYHARTKDWEQKIDAARREIEKEVEKKKSEILLDLPDGEDVHIQVNYGYSSRGGDKVELLLSVSRQVWNAGKNVDAPRSPAYCLENARHGDYIVTPRRNTPEGKKIAALIDAIPLTPSLNDYPELFGNTQKEKPHLHISDIGGYKFLVYSVPPNQTKQSIACPPDAQPIPTEIYQWLRLDEDDRRIGITPPPMPQKISNYLAKLRKAKSPKGPTPN